MPTITGRAAPPQLKRPVLNRYELLQTWRSIDLARPGQCTGTAGRRCLCAPVQLMHGESDFHSWNACGERDAIDMEITHEIAAWNSRTHILYRLSYRLLMRELHFGCISGSEFTQQEEDGHVDTR